MAAYNTVDSDFGFERTMERRQAMTNATNQNNDVMYRYTMSGILKLQQQWEKNGQKMSDEKWNSIIKSVLSMIYKLLIESEKLVCYIYSFCFKLFLIDNHRAKNKKQFS